MLLVFPSWKGFCFGLRGPDGRDPSRGSRLLSPIHPQISPTSRKRKQFDLSLDYWFNYRIELRDPLASVDLFQYKDSNGAVTVMAENTDFIVDTSRHPGFVSPPYYKTWPPFASWPSSAMLI